MFYKEGIQSRNSTPPHPPITHSLTREETKYEDTQAHGKQKIYKHVKQKIQKYQVGKSLPH